jgi:ankyrin repeat protein
LAAGHGHDKIVRLLIEKGADIHARNNIGTTALQLANMQGYKEVVRLLLKSNK